MDEEIFIPIVAILMPLFLVPTVIVLRQVGRRREWQHRERMKALELGVPVPGSNAWTARVAIALGAVMPIGVFGIAFLTHHTTGHDDVWLAAAAVGGLGVIGGIRLAGRAIATPPRDELQPGHGAHAGRTAKPSFNPDAYEEIVRHG